MQQLYAPFIKQFFVIFLPVLISQHISCCAFHICVATVFLHLCLILLLLLLLSRSYLTSFWIHLLRCHFIALPDLFSLIPSCIAACLFVSLLCTFPSLSNGLNENWLLRTFLHLWCYWSVSCQLIYNEARFFFCMWGCSGDFVYILSWELGWSDHHILPLGKIYSQCPVLITCFMQTLFPCNFVIFFFLSPSTIVAALSGAISHALSNWV